MDIQAIICEYNPFHNGHAYHIAQTKAGGADAVVCIMSGNFVQRGAPAITDKFTRAQAAIHGGANLVVELPHAFAMASAPRFAQAGVQLAALCGATGLSFGAETADPDALFRAVALLESPEIDARIRTHLAQGLDYPRAQTLAVSEHDPAAAELLRHPNNVLGIEYMRALRAFKGIKPHIIARFGAVHNADFENFVASATFIRRLLEAGSDGAPFLPKDSAALYRRELASGRAPVTTQNLDRAILAQLRRMDTQAFAKLPDVSEGLENRLARAAKSAATVEEFCDAVKTKRYTHARLRRIAMAAYTGLTALHQEKTPSYIRVLAFDRVGREILAGIEAPVITKPAAARDLSGHDAALFALEVQADALWALGYPAAQMRGGNPGLTKSPIYIDR